VEIDEEGTEKVDRDTTTDELMISEEYIVAETELAGRLEEVGAVKDDKDATLKELVIDEGYAVTERELESMKTAVSLG
jgi:hypothetical protein